MRQVGPLRNETYFLKNDEGLFGITVLICTVSPSGSTD